MSDLYGLAANHPGDRVVSPGALCWLGIGEWDPARPYVLGGAESVMVRVRSRGGRWVRRYLALWKLSNIRAKWLPPVGRKWRDESSWATREDAETIARRLDTSAQAELARRNMREVERMAGLMDENGRRNDGVQHGQ